MKKGLVTLVVMLCTNLLLAQTTIKGNVYDIYLEPVAFINISTNEASTTTNEDGNFTLVVKQLLPLKINITGVGYQSQKIEVTNYEEINIVLEKQSKLQEIIVSASRTPERVLESPVSVERFGVNDFKNTSSLNFFEGLANLKGIDVLHNSYNIKNIVSNRGFANTENTRFVQLVDGIETTLPYINYSLGNTMGPSDLDIKAVEILPGAASALYGPNAFNGIMLMTTKSPFEHKGISASIKGGVTSQESAGTNEFVDLNIRFAHVFNKKFATKVNFSYNKAEEWHATDKRNTTEQGGTIIAGLSHDDALDYDGLNVYGDEVDVNFVQLALLAGDIVANGGTLEGLPTGLDTQQLLSFAENRSISRVGFNEEDLIDYGSNAIKFDVGLYYRPFGDKKLEIELGAKFSNGDNIVHGYNRYSQENGATRQFRASITGEDFSLKGYYTQNSANLIDTRLLGIYVNNQFSSERDYFQNYIQAVITSKLSNTSEDSFRNGLNFAEEGKFTTGSTEFNSLVDSGKNTSIQDGGALLTDESSFYHIDANYNFRKLVNFIDFQLGGSFREYQLKSNGDIFSDKDTPIDIKEFGVYTQAQKKFLNDHLKVAFTARYDKSENFAFKVSPRASIAYAIGENKNHNIRFSYQTGFRNPTSQDQYANMNLGDRRIVGSVRDNLERISHEFQANSASGAAIIQGGVVISEREIIDNSYTATSAELFQEASYNDLTLDPTLTLADVILKNRDLLKKADLDYIRPETVQTFELGYRGAANIGDKLFEFDVAGFYNIFEDFLTHKSVVVPFYGDVDFPLSTNDLPGQALLLTDNEEYIIRTNAKGKINSYGFNIGFSTEIFNAFSLSASYAFSKLDTDNITDKDFNPEYNTPENVIKLSFGKEDLFKNFGFQLNGRWQDEYLYQSVFIQDVIESRIVLDTQVNYNIPSIKSRFKLGATNIGGKDYTSVAGAGSIGSQYYINWTINN